MTTIRILHVSDTHIPSSPLPSHVRICEALVDKIKDLRHEREIDLVAFTGDLTKSGAAEEFVVARAVLFDPLVTACGISADKLLIVPGNHDVDRSQIDPYAERGMREKLIDDPREIDALLANAGAIQSALRRMQHFNEFYEGLFGASDQEGEQFLHRFRKFSLQGIEVDALLLNTSWRSSGERDRGNLWLSAEGIEYLASRSQAPLRVGLQHHPTEWLSDTDQRECSPILRRTLTLHLTGHSHYRDSYKLTSSVGSTVHVKGGCLYESSQYEKVFAIIDVEYDDRPRQIMVRSFKYDAQLGFVQLSEGDSNVYTLSDEISGKWTSTHHVILPDIWRRLKELAIEKSITPQLIANTETERVSDIFTRPVLLKFPFGEVIARIEEEQSGVREFALSTDELVGALRSGMSIGLSGSADAGVTATILLMLDESCESIEKPAIYISCKNMTSGPRGIEALIRREMNELGFGITARDEVGTCTVGIDDLEHLGSRQIENVVEWVSTHPECNAVFGWHDDSGRVSGIVEKGLGDAAAYAHLGPMDAESAKSMVTLWSPAADVTMGDRVFELVKKEELPRNPFVLTLICYLVLEEIAGDDIENETVVLDRYVLHLLERASSGVSSRTDLDLDNWSKLLEALALEYRRKNVRFMARRDVDRLMIDVYDRLDWSGSPLRIVDQLVAWNVLREKDDEVGFWHPAICDLFLGRTLESEFKLGTSLGSGSYASTALGEPLKHFHPIRHCAQLTRGNLELLRQIGDLALNDDGLLTDQKSLVEGGPVLEAMDRDDAVGLSGLAAFGSSSSDERAESGGEDKTGSDEKERDRDSAGEWREYHTEQNRQLGMTTFDSPELISRSMTVLRKASLVSIVVRSSERIEDQRMKREVVTSALRLWSVAFTELGKDEVLGIGLEGAIARAVEAWGGADNASASEKDRRARGLKDMLLGLVVMSGVIKDLASSKLVKALRDVIDGGEISSDILAVTLGSIALADGLRPHDASWVNELRKAYTQTGKRPISRELIFGYLLMVLSGIQPGAAVNEDALSLMADLAMDGRGRTGPGIRSVEKTRVMESIRRRLTPKKSSGPPKSL